MFIATSPVIIRKRVGIIQTTRLVAGMILVIFPSQFLEFSLLLVNVCIVLYGIVSLYCIANNKV